MKTIIALLLATCGLGFLTGCEHEHWGHEHGGYGRPAPGYEYGTGGYYHYDHDWDRR